MCCLGSPSLVLKYEPTGNTHRPAGIGKSPGFNSLSLKLCCMSVTQLADIPFEVWEKLRSYGEKSVKEAVRTKDKRLFKRSSKNQPMEMSSKKPVSRLREVVSSSGRWGKEFCLCLTTASRTHQYVAEVWSWRIGKNRAVGFAGHLQQGSCEGLVIFFTILRTKSDKWMASHCTPGPSS